MLVWIMTHYFKYPNGDQREGFFSENVLDGQVIYTRANGQIVIELWKNGERLPDRQVVVQESPTASSPEETTQASLLTRTTSTSTIPSPPQSSPSQPFDLSDIRQTIRSGDRFQLKSREPKKEARMDVVALRKETDESNRDFLFKVFQRVNGSWVLIMKEKVRILWLLLVEYVVEYIIPCLHSGLVFYSVTKSRENHPSSTGKSFSLLITTISHGALVKEEREKNFFLYELVVKTALTWTNGNYVWWQMNHLSWGWQTHPTSGWCHFPSSSFSSGDKG